MSKKFLRQCLWSIDKVFLNSKHLSFQARHDYLLSMKRMAHELHEKGYQLSSIWHLKPKHVEYLIEKWQDDDLSVATIKNRLSQIRFIFNHINKGHLMPKANIDLNIGRRTYISNENRAIHQIDISKFEDRLIKYTVRLQQQFGLRREEAIKFKVGIADKGKEIKLKPSWTKGGVGRTIPVLTQEQRALLDEIKVEVGLKESLIAEGKMYAQQKRAYARAVYKAGYKNLHGLRHAYAQRRYFEITNHLTQGRGWQSPLNGGKHVKELSEEERIIDTEARMVVSYELGHARKQISNTYLGI